MRLSASFPLVTLALLLGLNSRAFAAAPPKSDGIVLKNGSLSLTWSQGGIDVLNGLSGTTWRMAFPAFAVEWPGRVASGEKMELVGAESSGNRARFEFRDPSSGLTAEVVYELEGEQPWFRKRVTLQAGGALPTPARVVVDRQPQAPSPVHQVGWGLRYGDQVVGEKGFKAYARRKAGWGEPLWVGDWFAGLERPVGYTRPFEQGIELYHHPVWKEGRIECFPAIYGAAKRPEQVSAAFGDYLEHVRLPAITKPFVMISAGYSQRYIGGGEYVDSMDANDRFLDAILALDLKPDGIGLDAGYFDRRSLYRAKGDDSADTRLTAFSRRVRAAGMNLSLWVTHNGPVGMDMGWVRSQGWPTGTGPGSYGAGEPNVEFAVLLDPKFEDALAKRWGQLVGPVGVHHLKIDWDNDCATNGSFSAVYPTYDHVREATVNAMNRIDRRLRAINPDLITRNGWWPSPWWLCHANHVWLADSGDSQYSDWPSRTQQDRELTQRDASYDNVVRMAQSAVPLNAFDNHGFAAALDNPFSYQPQTWLDNLVMQFTRGTLYMHFALCPEDLRDWQAQALRQSLQWFREHAPGLIDRHSTMVGGHPALGEIYGYLHPDGEDAAWLVLRNPSPQPQRINPDLARWLGWAPRTVRQVHPYWSDLSLLQPIVFLGEEVRLLRLYRERQPDISPIPGSPFMVRPVAGGFDYEFPGNRPLTNAIGPTVHPEMQIPQLTAEPTANGPIANGWRKQWYVGVPHRFEKAELIVTIRAPQKVLDGLTVRAGSNMDRARPAVNPLPIERLFRREERGLNSSLVMPSLGERQRDDYVVRFIPDGGWSSITLDVLGEKAGTAQIECWFTGYEAPARRTLRRANGPMDGGLLPAYPLGFSRALEAP